MKQSQIIICVGAGGVGKTTVASVLGFHHALLGRKTLVITVDPARRLLDALDIRAKAGVPKKVDIKRLSGQSPKRGGALFAYMPDLKHEWMDFLNASISREQVRHEISSNHFYRYLVDGLPGALEIVCSHILFRLVDEAVYDVIILDTPPSSHSLVFFDVPKRIIRVLEQGIFHQIIKRQNSFLLKMTKKLAFLSGGFFLQTLEKLIGSHFLSELIDFALTIDGLYQPMLARARSMDQMLKDKATTYVLVARPTLASVNDSLKLQKALKTRGLVINELVLNQVMPSFTLMQVDEEKSALSPIDTTIDQALALYKQKAALEEALIARINKSFSSKPPRLLFLKSRKVRASLMAELLQDYQRIE